MKFVASNVGVLQVLQNYRLSLCPSTAIEVLLTTMRSTGSWIWILVRAKKKSVIIIQILLISILHLDLYSRLCTIKVDLSHLWNTSNVQTLPKITFPGVYYKVDFYVVLLFGGTEIQAQICWEENVRSTIYGNCLLFRDWLCWLLSLIYF